MDFAFNESEGQVREAVQQMLKRLEPRRAEFRKRMVVDKQFPMELWSVFAEAGLLGSIIPEEYGGTGMGLVALTIAMEELGAKGLANALLVVTSMDVACIVRNASEDVKKRFLPKVASGEWKLCLALTEPNAGSNSLRIETSATL